VAVTKRLLVLNETLDSTIIEHGTLVPLLVAAEGLK
jgi:hypothetical protein